MLAPEEACCVDELLQHESSVQGQRAYSGYGAGVMSVAWCSVNEHQVVGGDASGEMRLFDIRRAGTLHSFDLSDASASSTTAQTSVVSPADTSRYGFISAALLGSCVVNTASCWFGSMLGCT